MTGARSLAGRLMVGLGLAIALAWLVAVAVSAVVLNDELAEASDVALRKTAEALIPYAVDALRQEGEAALPRPRALSYDDEIVAFQLRDAAGALALRNDEAPLEAFDVGLRRGFSDAAGFRVYTVPVDGGYLHVGDPAAHRREAVVETTLGLLGPLALLLPAMLGLVLLITRRSLAPLAALQSEIGERGGDNLAPMSAAAIPRDLAPTVVALNRLLDRLRRTLDAERGFAAAAAHELRTPIAGAIAETQLLRSELGPGQAGGRADRIEAALKRMARLSEKLLDLARAEAVAVRTGRRTDLMPALRLVLDGFRDARVELGPDSPTLEGRIDPDAFAILARNLIENAVRHGPTDGRVAVTATGGSLVVTNGGPALAPATLEEITGRFRRGTSASAGSGLGLAIAETIAERAGVALALSSPAAGRPDGFEARLDLGD